MKCIRCGTDSRRSERADGRCPKCSERFAFEPVGSDPWTDPMFQAAIDAVSQKGKVSFTVAQLHHAVERRWASPVSWAAVVAWLGAGVGLVAALCAGEVLLGLGIAVVGLGVWLWRRWRVVPPVLRMERDTFGGMVRRWEDAHGPVRGLVRVKRAPKQPIPEELREYSFDRVVVTDTAENAEILLANDFHFENACAVLSVDGHPAGVFDDVREMVRANPAIEVFALHDCSPEGCTLAARLAGDPRWFQGVGRVTDVGLRPRHVERMDIARIPVSEPCAQHEGLTAEEAAFLGRWRVELAGLPPDQVVKRLFRAMKGSREGEGSGGGADGADPILLPGVVSDGGGDAFG